MDPGINCFQNIWSLFCFMRDVKWVPTYIPFPAICTRKMSIYDLGQRVQWLPRWEVIFQFFGIRMTKRAKCSASNILFFFHSIYISKYSMSISSYDNLYKSILPTPSKKIMVGKPEVKIIKSECKTIYTGQSY